MNLLFNLIILIIIIYLIICLGLFFFQNRLIFFPSHLMENTPKDYGLNYQEIILNFPNQDTLSGWWIPNQNSKKVLLYLHGNGENISTNLTQAYPFYQLGLSLFLIDYRSYGNSKGKFPTEKQVYEDAQKAWHYLTIEKQISPDQIIVFGHSLGGAIAIELATRHPEISALIIEGSFTSLIDMANYQGYGKFFPIKLLINQKFNSLEKVKTLKMPILFTHGTADDIIPDQMSRKLYDQAQGKKELLLIPEGNHHDIFKMDEKTYLATVKKFI